MSGDESMYYSEFGGVKDDRFTRNTYIALDDNFENKAANFIQDRNCTDVYCTTFIYDNMDVKEASLYGDLYFDIDGNIEDEEGYRSVKKEALLIMGFLNTRMQIKYEQMRLYYSGSKGFHITVPAETIGIEPKEDLNEDFRMLASLIKREINGQYLDMKIYDRRRLFRLVNSINGKTGLYKVPIPLTMLYTSSLEAIKQWAETTHADITAAPAFSREAKERYEKLLKNEKDKETAKSSGRNKTEKVIIPDTERPLLPCVKQILTDGVTEGQRNNTAVAVASSLLQAGKAVDEIEEIMQTWNSTKNMPPLPEKEITQVVNSAYDLASNGQGYGCNTFWELGYCTGLECNIYKR